MPKPVTITHLDDHELVTKGFLRSELLEYNTSFMEMLTNFKDEIMDELKSMREEMAAGQYRQFEHSNQLENHEHRLTTVERQLGSS